MQIEKIKIKKGRQTYKKIQIERESAREREKKERDKDILKERKRDYCEKMKGR